MSANAKVMRPLLRWLAWLAFAAIGLQLYFLLRVSLMLMWDPQSTAFERSEAWRLATTIGEACLVSAASIRQKPAPIARAASGLNSDGTRPRMS